MEQALAERVGAVLGARPVSWEAAGRGYTNNERWLVRLAGGGTAFVKAAVDAQTAGWLRAEYRVYAQLQAPFLPRLLGWADDGQAPLLLLEDLRDAFWPPPWSRARVESVLATLRQVAASRPPAGLRRLEEDREALRGWREVAEAPAPFLGLGLCSAGWLAAALPVLLTASEEAVLEGEALVHFDVRSDNLCLVGERAKLIDWNFAALGNPLADLAAWLPSLQAEGGPAPEEILPRGGAELAGLVSGYFAARAGLPPPPTAPRVRAVQLVQLRAALPWAARALGLPPPDGAHA